MISEKLTLENVCGGALPELFKRHLAFMLKNIRDPNTDPGQKRTLTFELTFKPHSDRCGADVIIGVKEKLASTQPIKGAVYVSAINGELAAYPRDPRQEVMFGSEDDTRQ